MIDENDLKGLSKIEIYAEILLGILRYTLAKEEYDEKKYHAELTKKLKFEKETDSRLLRACIDLLEDTQHAINEVFDNGLMTASGGFGERYLRLYGVLNAYYMQLGAIVDLMRLFNIEGQKQMARSLKTYKLIELRNKIASHNTCYNVPGSEKETDFYRLTQTSVNAEGSRLSIVGKDNYEEVDLIQNMKQLTYEFECVLDKIVKKEIYTRTFKKEAFDWLNSRYRFLQKK